MRNLLFILLITILSVNICKADQLEMITKAQAITATKFLQSQTDVISWCSCCAKYDNNIEKQIIIISKVYYKKVDPNSTDLENYYVFIEGEILGENKLFNENVDLAYIFIKKEAPNTLNGVAVSLGKVLGFKCDPCTNNFSYPEWAETVDSAVEDSPENHFNVFYNTSGDELAEVFISHQPTLNDCKSIFKTNFAQSAWKYYNTGNRNIGIQLEKLENDFKTHPYFRVNKFNSNDVINNDCQICPGKLNKLALKLKPNNEFYIVEFLENENSENGINFTFFTQIEGRWIFVAM